MKIKHIFIRELQVLVVSSLLLIIAYNQLLLRGTTHPPRHHGNQASVSRCLEHQYCNGLPRPKMVPRRTAVLLLTYMRGGSTFLGEVFNQNEEAFYWFEPLPAVFDKFYSRSDKRCRKLFCQIFNSNGTIRHPPENEMRALTAPLTNIFTCNITALPTRMLSHKFMTSRIWTSKNRKMADFFACKKKMNGSKALNTCLPEMVKDCEDSSIVAAKVIRLRMDLVERVLHSLPQDVSFKVIHLIRDPRGILVSRSSSSKRSRSKYLFEENAKSLNETIDYSNTLCRQILVNIEMEEKLKERFPSVFLRLRYEYLATSTESALKDVYKFIGSKLSSSLEKRLLSMTHSKKQNSNIGTQRTNSTRTAFRWKSAMSQSLLSSISEEPYCRDLFRLFSQHDKHYL